MGGGSFLGVKMPSLNEIGNVAVQAGTAGVFGINDNGQIGNGITSNNVRDGFSRLALEGQNALNDTGKFLKDITGATAQEEMLKQQQQQIIQRQREIEENKKAGLKRMELEDRLRSQLAGARNKQGAFSEAGTGTVNAEEITDLLGV